MDEDSLNEHANNGGFDDFYEELDEVGSKLLKQLEFRNGSLYHQMEESEHWANRSAYPLHEVDPGVNLTIFPNDTANLAFPVGNGNVSVAMPLVSMLLQPNATRLEVFCTYPLSGQYDVLPRFMFYSLLVVAIVFRRRGWLASAALATAMTYTTVAAVHLWVLLGAYRWGLPLGERVFEEGDDFGWDTRSSKEYGDIDFFGIMPVITAAGIMLPPLLTWSSTYRHDRSGTVLIYWSIFIMVSLVCVIVLWNKEWVTNELPSFAYCASTAPECSWNRLFEHFTLEQYDDCDCVDFCGALGPPAPLRQSANMVPELKRFITQAVNTEDTIWEQMQKTVWVGCLIHSVFALIYCRWSPEQILHKVYRLVAGQKRRPVGEVKSLKGYNPSTRWTGRKILARLVAGSFYFFSIASLFIYPALFIINAVLCELVVATLPTSEHSDAIGAWSPWIGLALILGASIMMRTDLVKRFRNRIKRKRSATTQDAKMAQDANFEASPVPKPKSRWRLHHFTDLLTWAGRYRMLMFWRWWKDPDVACDEFDEDNEHRQSMISEIEEMRKEIDRKQAALEMYRYPQQSACLCGICASRSRSPTSNIPHPPHEDYPMRLSLMKSRPCSSIIRDATWQDEKHRPDLHQQDWSKSNQPSHPSGFGLKRSETWDSYSSRQSQRTLPEYSRGGFPRKPLPPAVTRTRVKEVDEDAMSDVLSYYDTKF